MNPLNPRACQPFVRNCLLLGYAANVEPSRTRSRGGANDVARKIATHRQLEINLKSGTRYAQVVRRFRGEATLQFRWPRAPAPTADSMPPMRGGDLAGNRLAV